jgi:hypothetical protein
MENELLMQDIFIPINPDDNDEEHLVEMWSNLQTKNAEIHKVSHIQAMIAKWTVPQGMNQQAQQNEQAMSNSMQSQAMSQAGATLQ